MTQASEAMMGGTVRRRLPLLWLTLPGLAFLALFLLLPAAQLLFQSVLDRTGESFTLASYQRAFTSGVYLRIMGTTFVVALETTVLCLVLGCPLACWLVGLPPRRQRLVGVLILMAYWTSSLVKNFVWLVLLGRTGPLSQFSAWLGLGPLDMLFDRSAVLFGMVHTMLPLAVVAMLPVMSRIDRRLLLAAETLGASRIQATWLVFLQLAMPGIAAAGLLVFVGSLGFFITPALLGGPRETMIGQSIIQQIRQFQNLPLAAALSTMLVVATIAVCLLYDRVFGLSTMSGTARPSRRPGRWTRRLGLAVLGRLAAFFGAVSEAAARRLGGHRLGWLLPAYGWTMIVLLLLPILLLVPMAFTSSTFLSLPPEGFSLRWFAAYLQSPLWILATLRSFAIGMLVAAGSVTLATLAAYGLARSGSRFAPAIYLTFLVPMILPPIVIAVAIFYVFSSLALVGSDTGIVIGHMVMALPVAFVIVSASLSGFDWRLEQAAETLGAGAWRRLWRVTLPLMRGGIVAGAIFAFLVSFEELTVALFIGGGLKSTLPKQMWDSVLLQVEPTLAAASLLVVLIGMGLFVLGEWLRAGTEGPCHEG